MMRSIATVRFTIVAGLVLATSLSSQAASWNIPKRGVAYFERERSVKNLGGKGRTGTRVAVEMPPLLFQGELDSKQQFIMVPPADLRDLPMWIAFDLRSSRVKGKLKGKAKGHHDYAPGELALKLLTLVKAGVNLRDPAVVHGFDELRRYRIDNTYSLATTMMALKQAAPPLPAITGR
jgi:hypothetical protein